jgi:hypothetical protein
VLQRAWIRVWDREWPILAHLPNLHDPWSGSFVVPDPQMQLADFETATDIRFEDGRTGRIVVVQIVKGVARFRRA